MYRQELIKVLHQANEDYIQGIAEVKPKEGCKGPPPITIENRHIFEEEVNGKYRHALMTLLQLLFKDKAEQMKQTYPGDAELEISEVPVHMEDVACHIDLIKSLGMQAAREVLRSECFKHNVYLAGHHIFCAKPKTADS